MEESKEEVAEKKKRKSGNTEVKKNDKEGKTNEFLGLMELALELSEKVPELKSTRRVFDLLLGMQFNRQWKTTKSAALRQTSLAGRMFEEMIKQSSERDVKEKVSSNCEDGAMASLAERLSVIVLSFSCWKSINKESRLSFLSCSLMSEFRDTNGMLQTLFDAVIRNPRMQIQTVLEDTKSEEYLNSIVLMDTLHALSDRWLKAVRPCLANIETFLERRNAMNEMADLDLVAILRCVDVQGYKALEAELASAIKQGILEAVAAANSTEAPCASLPKSSTPVSTNFAQAHQDDNDVNRLAEGDDGFAYDGLESSLRRAFQNEQGMEKDLNKNRGLRIFQTLVENTNTKHRRDLKIKSRPKLQNYSAESLLGSNSLRVLRYVRKRTMSFLFTEDLVDYYMISACCSLMTCALAELMKNKEMVNSVVGQLQTLATHFIRVGLPLLERLFNGFEPNFVFFNIVNLSLRGLIPGAGVDSVPERIVYKLRVLSAILQSFDIYLFPRTIKCHEGTVRSISRSHLDPEIILTGGDDRLIRIWDTRSGECMGLFAGHKSIVTWCRFTPDDLYMVSCSFDTTIKVWESRTGRCRTTLQGHTDSIIDADISPNGKLILSASMDGTVRLWSLTSTSCYRIFRGHEGDTWVKSVKFLKDGSGFVSGGLDGNVVLWSLKAPKQKEPDAVVVGGGGEGEPPHALNAESEEETRQSANPHDEEGFPPLRPTYIWSELHSDYILDLALLPVETSPVKVPLLLCVSKDAKQTIVDLDSFVIRKTLYPSIKATSTTTTTTQAKSWCSCGKFSSDGRLFALASFDNCIRIHSTHNGALLRQLRVHNDGVSRVEFSHDARFLFVGSSTGSIQVLPL